MVFFVPDDTAATGPAGAVGTGDYGSVWDADISVALAIVGGVFSTIPAFGTNGAANNTTPDGASDRLTVDVTGTWIVTYGITFAYSLGSVCQSILTVNSVQQTVVRAQHTGTTGVFTMGAWGPLSLTAGDILEVEFTAVAGGTATFFQTNLRAKRVA